VTYTHEQLNDLRQRVLAGQDVSIEEYAAIIQSLRARRTGDVEAAVAKKASRTKSPKADVELPDLLKDL
jgi:hypothetical protein